MKKCKCIKKYDYWYGELGITLSFNVGEIYECILNIMYE